MQIRGKLHIDPGALELADGQGQLEIVIPYTEWSTTEALLRRVDALTAGLNPVITLVAVHTVPYPAPFACPTSVHAYLVEQLIALADRSSVPVTPHVVLARTAEEGFRHALTPDSTILIGSRKRFWRTQEESLARILAREGHRVALVHID